MCNNSLYFLKFQLRFVFNSNFPSYKLQ
jgi:hypothetical protein